MLGGIKGVIYTDLLQAFLLVAGWAVVTLFLLQLLPGRMAGAFHTAIANDKLRLLDFSLDPRVPATFWAGMIAMLFTHLALAGVNQTQVQSFSRSRAWRRPPRHPVSWLHHRSPCT
jgi:Na+/proline symporter